MPWQMIELHSGGEPVWINPLAIEYVRRDIQSKARSSVWINGYRMGIDESVDVLLAAIERALVTPPDEA